MAMQPIQWSHVDILARTHARYAVRGGSGLIYLMAFLMIGLSIAGMMFEKVETGLRLAETAEQQGIEAKDMLVMTARPIVGWWVGADDSPGAKDPFVEHLIVEKPALLSAYLLVLMAFIPFASSLASFNLLAGDIGTKGLRYLLLRTERINIIVARFLGTLLFTAVVSLAAMLFVVVYMAVKFDYNTFGEVLGWGLQGWLAIMLLSLPYLCLGMWISAALDSPIASLVLCVLVTGFPLIFLKVARATLSQNYDVAWLDRLTPWGWKYDLLHPAWSQSLLAVAVMLGFSLVIGFMAVRHFLKRDL